MRILVVLAEPDLDQEVRRHCKELIEDGHEIALCYALTSENTLQETLAVQRRITGCLRYILESKAEAIPVFVVTGQDGDGIDDCAKTWGATDVSR